MSIAFAVLVGLSLSANPYLSEGRSLYEAQRYEEAARRLALGPREALTSPERRELFGLLAKARFALNQRDAASAAYAELLAQDPRAPDPTQVAPPLRELFNTAKRKLYPLDFVTLRRLPARAGRVRAELVDPWHRVASVVNELPTGAGSLTPDADGTLDLPAAELAGALVARAADGLEVARLDIPGKPVSAVTAPRPEATAPVPTPPPRVRQRKTWSLYVFGATAVATAATGAALLAASSGERTQARAAQYAASRRLYEDRSRRNSVTAQGLLGGTAASLGVGAALYFLF